MDQAVPEAMGILANWFLIDTDGESNKMANDKNILRDHNSYRYTLIYRCTIDETSAR